MLLGNMVSYSSSIARCQWGSVNVLQTEVMTGELQGSGSGGELQTVHGLGDPDSMTSDHRWMLRGSQTTATGW
jgi:hypothetical protein